MIKRSWNYIFYSTWKLHDKASAIIIIPLVFIFKKFKPIREKWNEQGEKEWRKIIKNKDLGFNVLFAYGIMLFTTSVLYTMLVLYICHFLHVKIGENNAWYFFVSIIASSILTNEVLSWWNDRYLKYFVKFEKTKSAPLVYLPGVTFHLGIAMFAILTVHWRIGFQF